MYKNRFISNVILSKRSSSLANTASFRKAKAKCLEYSWPYLIYYHVQMSWYWKTLALPMVNLTSGLLQTFQLDRLALMFHQGAINNFHAIGLGIFWEKLFSWQCQTDLKQINKYLSVVNRSIIMTLICRLDVVQSSFERAGVQSFWEAFKRIEGF